MRPIDFVIFDGDSDPCVTAREVADAAEKDITILACDGEYEILSYYLVDGRFVLDIQRKRSCNSDLPPL